MIEPQGSGAVGAEETVGESGVDRAASGGTRRTILSTAADLASARGLEQLSIGQLASAVGMSKSGLYAHFGSKEELQLATIEHAWEVFEAEVLRDSPADADALDALVERWLSYFERQVFPGGCFFVTVAVEQANRPGPVLDALATVLVRELKALEEAVRKADEAGGLEAGDDAGETAFGVHSILLNANALFQVRRDPAVFQQARAAIRDLLRPSDGGSQ